MSRSFLMPKEAYSLTGKVTIAEWPWKFWVESRTKPLPRLVDWQQQRCDCPAGQCKKPCRHLRLVNEYAPVLWRRIIARMTTTDAGWQLLRDCETFVKNH